MATTDGISGDSNYEAKMKFKKNQEDIDDLLYTLRTAEIIPTATTEDIQIGSKFSVEVTFDDGDVEQFTGTLVEDTVITGMEEGNIVLYTTKASLGQAILGKKSRRILFAGEKIMELY